MESVNQYRFTLGSKGAHGSAHYNRFALKASANFLVDTTKGSGSVLGAQIESLEGTKSFIGGCIV